MQELTAKEAEGKESRSSAAMIAGPATSPKFHRQGSIKICPVKPADPPVFVDGTLAALLWSERIHKEPCRA